MRKTLLLVITGLCALIILSACQTIEDRVEVTPQPTASATPFAPVIERIEVEPAVIPLEPEPTEPIPPDEDPPLTDGLDCGETFCQIAWPGWLERPIEFGFTRTIDRSYPYGSTGGGVYDLHHGVEFLNGYGTPVLAAQDGEVTFAGMDDQIKVGPYHWFYGNVVVLKHPGLVGNEEDVFTLYAHLSEINVGLGDQVSAGDVIGKIGASGAAYGPHLHFESRVEVNDYGHTANPVVWFAPLDDPDQPQTALLAGLILDRSGAPLPEFPLTLEKLTETGVVETYFYPLTYQASSVNGHPVLGENFAVPDIPAGDYRLAFIYGKFYEIFFTLEPGSLGFIKVEVD